MTTACHKTLALAALIGALTFGTALAEDEYASIPFVDLGGIESWRAETNEAILIEARNGEWFRATFFAPCIPLTFSLNVGFVTGPVGTLDKFDSILVDGQRCYFQTFEQIGSPAKATSDRENETGIEPAGDEQEFESESENEGQ